jgi:alkylhydroperoxidase family enzyme
MPRIRTVPVDGATGLLGKEYEAAIRRAGRVFHILSIQSLHPPVLRAGVRLYQALMLGPGPLARPVREMLATVTSRALDCFY